MNNSKMPHLNTEQDEAEIQTWYRKRWWTTALAMAQSCLLFFEYSAFQISALYYFEKDFNVTNPKLFYSLSMGIIFVSGLGSVVACGQYMDRTGDLRSIFISTLLLNSLGNLMYTWTISPYFPLIGRFLAGVTMGVQTAVSGKCGFKVIQMLFPLHTYSLL